MGAITNSTNRLTISFDNKFTGAKCRFSEFPFKSVLSLDSLIEVWEGATKEKQKIKSSIAAPVLEKLNGIPELRGPIKDSSILKKHEDIVDVLMSVIYPAAQWDRLIQASIAPFQWKAIYSTPLFDKIFNVNEEKVKKLKEDSKHMLVGKTISAYVSILKQVYDINVKFGTPFVYGIEDESTGLTRYFQLNFDSTYVKIKVVGEKPELTPENVKELLKDITDLETWAKYLPTDRFEFHGFVTLYAINITDQEVLSQLKHDLLSRESIISIERFKTLEQKLRDLFRVPDLKLGLAAIPTDWNRFEEYGRKIGDSFMFNAIDKVSCNDFSNSIYDIAMSKGKPVIIEDLVECTDKTIIENELLNQGIKSFALAPLYHQNELIGVLELGSRKPNEINSLNAIKLNGILPLFSTAVQRSVDELENDIQAIIKEECTAIHPSVEWKFKQAAFNLILKREHEKTAEMESIVFDNVFPLYGLSDIRNSSTVRNESIQSDLIEHLTMAREVIQSAMEIKPLPYLDSLSFRINKHISGIKSGLSSGDELSIIEFLQKEVESTFDNLGSTNSSLKELVDNYRKSLDPNLNSFYNKRKDFEESVAIINEVIASYLDEAEIKSQEMFPHYFEKYKTDGVEHGIYIGQSLVENQTFDEIYLRNLRLWQIMVMCNVVRKTVDIKPFLKIPLDTAHLILIQNTPLSIRFRLDEKKFDVDGTYNIRYEIMKKRIDKAVINGSKERLTQPGKIAMVYSHSREAAEYKKYIEYLQSKGYLENELEELELESLQGVQGLKALRVKVNLKSINTEGIIDYKEMSETISNLREQPLN